MPPTSQCLWLPDKAIEKPHQGGQKILILSFGAKWCQKSFSLFPNFIARHFMSHPVRILSALLQARALALKSSTREDTELEKGAAFNAACRSSEQKPLINVPSARWTSSEPGTPICVQISLWTASWFSIVLEDESPRFWKGALALSLPAFKQKTYTRVAGSCRVDMERIKADLIRVILTGILGSIKEERISHGDRSKADELQKT